jgi:hypothetical protein
MPPGLGFIRPDTAGALPVVPTLYATAVGTLCTAVASNFPPNATFTVRWGDSRNSDHPTGPGGGGSWQHTYTAARTYTISARPVADPNTVVASTTVTIVKAALLPVEEP